MSQTPASALLLCHAVCTSLLISGQRAQNLSSSKALVLTTSQRFDAELQVLLRVLYVTKQLSILQPVIQLTAKKAT